MANNRLHVLYFCLSLILFLFISSTLNISLFHNIMAVLFVSRIRVIQLFSFSVIILFHIFFLLYGIWWRFLWFIFFIFGRFLQPSVIFLWLLFQNKWYHGTVLACLTLVCQMHTYTYAYSMYGCLLAFTQRSL